VCSGGARTNWVAPPWTQALQLLVESVTAEALRYQLPGSIVELARILPTVRQLLLDIPEPEPIAEPEAAQFRLFVAVTTFLQHAAADTPLVLVLDDLHWADRTSLRLFEHIAIEGARARLLLVGTYRDIELGRQHPLEQALAGIGRAEHFQTIDLRGLSEADTAPYLRATTGADLSVAAINSIYGETEGNAFFLEEVVTLMAQAGTLESGAVSVPPSMRAAIGQRLNALSDECHELLRVATVFGREFSDELLARATDDDATDVPELLETALSAGVIAEAERAGEYRFAHALIRETLLGEMRARQRVRLHARIAQVLAQLHGDDGAEDHAAELAYHLVESAALGRDQTIRALRYSRLAAERAEAQFGWDEAAGHYESCLMLIEDAADHLGEEEAELHEALGRCRVWARLALPTARDHALS
jgi:predicted ATPase